MNASLTHPISFYFSLFILSLPFLFLFFTLQNTQHSKRPHQRVRAYQERPSGQETGPTSENGHKVPTHRERIKTWPLTENNIVLQTKTFTKTLPTVVAPETKTRQLGYLIMQSPIISSFIIQLPYYLSRYISRLVSRQFPQSLAGLFLV